MPLFRPNHVGMKDYVRVENTPIFVNAFRQLYSKQTDILYNHSPIFPFSYLNKGQMKLYLNKDFADGNMLPIVRKHELTLDHAPSFSLHCPDAPNDKILATVEYFKNFSSCDVDITDVTRSFADAFVVQNFSWEKFKTSDDVIQQADKLASLTGRNFSSLRNTLKHVREDLKPEIKPLDASTLNDAKSVFLNWKAKQGAKYFRVTIGRDVRLMEEYFDKTDLVNFFSFVYYVNGKPSAANYGCRSFKDPTYGIDVTVKADIDCKGLGDFAFVHLMAEMNKKGIILVNDSGGTGKVLLNKMKFRPLCKIQMYDLRLRNPA